MAAAAPWIGAYVVVLAFWVIVLLLVRRPTMWKGRSLLIVNSAFVAAAAAAMAARGQLPGIPLLAFLLFLVITGVGARGRAVLLHIDRTKAEETLERCLVQTRASFRRESDCYVVRAAPGDMLIALRGRPPVIGIRFTGGARSKKAELVRALFGKQFSGSFPTIRVPT